MKKAIILALALALLFALAACGAEPEPVSLSEVYQTITAEVPSDFEAVTFTADDMMWLYGIDGAALEDVVAVQDESGYKIEIVMMRAADAAAAQQTATLLEQHIEVQKDSMRNYDAAQYAVLEKSKVTVKGEYVAMFISEHQDQMIQIFTDAVS